MGDIVITEATQDVIEIDIAGTRPGDRVRLVQSGDVIEEDRVDARRYTRKYDITISGPVTCIRIELYSEDRAAKAFSNPLCYVRNAPTQTSRSTRARLKGPPGPE